MIDTCGTSPTALLRVRFGLILEEIPLMIVPITNSGGFQNNVPQVTKPQNSVSRFEGRNGVLIIFETNSTNPVQSRKGQKTEYRKALQPETYQAD